MIGISCLRFLFGMKRNKYREKKSYSENWLNHKGLHEIVVLQFYTLEQ